jgi:hypothetical protein
VRRARPRRGASAAQEVARAGEEARARRPAHSSDGSSAVRGRQALDRLAAAGCGLARLRRAWLGRARGWQHAGCWRAAGAGTLAREAQVRDTWAVQTCSRSVRALERRFGRAQERSAGGGLERVSKCCVRRLGSGRRWRARGSKQQAAASAGVDAARAGGMAQIHEQYAGQAALKRSSRRGGARVEEDWHGSAGAGLRLAVLARAYEWSCGCGTRTV